MCGRSACTLAPDEICKACSFPSKSSKNLTLPKWQDHPGGYNYSPSSNVAPTCFCPVMIRNDMLPNQKFKRSSDGEKINLEYVIQPMMWGLIPDFHKGDSAKSHGYKTNNCRIEDLENKKMFQPSMNKGQRCVVLFDGFYEWQTTKRDKNKQPYYIYSSQPKGIEIWNRKSWEKNSLWSEDSGWNGPNLLKMAGFFSHWTSSEGEEVYSFTILTMESGDSFSWLHHRIPAILESQEDIEAWLNHDDLNYKTLLARFKKDPELQWHPVSTLVNFSKNKDQKLMVPVSLDELKKPKSAEGKFMAAWLKKDEKNTK